MTSMLEHLEKQDLLESGKSDNTVLEEINLKLGWLTPSERLKLEDELCMVWLREDYPKTIKEGE